MRIRLARTVVVWQCVGVGEVVVNHILSLALVEVAIFEVHDSVADQDSLEVDWVGAGVLVELIDQYSQVWDVLAGIGLASDPESVLQVLRIFLEEINQSIHVIVGSCEVEMFIVGVQVVGVAYASRGLEEEQV